jgi:hypothetical protein
MKTGEVRRRKLVVASSLNVSNLFSNLESRERDSKVGVLSVSYRMLGMSRIYQVRRHT